LRRDLSISNGIPVLEREPVVTTRFPVVDRGGTVAMIAPGLQVFVLALTPLKVTLPDEPKL